MNFALLCEGFSDFVLMQYILHRLYGWEDFKGSSLADRQDSLYARELKKNHDTLTVISAGGCSRMQDRFEMLLQRNAYAAKTDELFDKIVILTDNDDENVEANVQAYVRNALASVAANPNATIVIENKKWASFTMKNGRQQIVEVSLLPLIIPFDENGALETLLLKAVSEKDSYDKEIIRKGNAFVESVDPECRYLTGRGRVTKAKFDVYFSIRTSSEQFGERRNILKNIPWEYFSVVKETFAELGNL